MGLLPDTWDFGLRMHRECRERFPGQHGLASPTSITARAWHTCRGACRDRQLAFCIEVAGGENDPGIPSACATHNFTYLAKGQCQVHIPSFLRITSSLMVFIPDCFIRTWIFVQDSLTWTTRGQITHDCNVIAAILRGVSRSIPIRTNRNISGSLVVSWYQRTVGHKIHNCSKRISHC